MYKLDGEILLLVETCNPKEDIIFTDYDNLEVFFLNHI